MDVQLFMVYSNLTQIEPGPRVHCIQQFLPQRARALVPRQLQQVHTRTRARKPLLVLARVADAEPWMQVAEPQQRRPWCRRDKPKHLPSLLVCHLLHYLPK